MRLKYDFHIHSVLSACAVEEMTPNNIVNMALINELDVIAVSDHNSCDNAEAIMKVAEDTDLLVIPGIEVSTSEEIHVLCLFKDLEQAQQMKEIVYERLPNIKSNEKIFGKQILMNSEDEEVGRVDRLLSFSANISIDELVEKAEEIGGIAIPAHIDRASHSVLSNLGMIPNYLNIPTIEISQYVSKEDYEQQYADYNIIQTSDAHELGYIGICDQFIEAEEKTVEAILDCLKSNKVNL